MTAKRQRQVTHASVHLWRVDLNIRAEAEADFCKRLSPGEIAKAEGFVSPSARQRYIVARGSLRMLLGPFLNEPPQSIPIEVGHSGKPRIVGSGHGIRFNVSHSADLAMICIADCGDVGVDLESVRHVPSALAITRRHFSPTEASFVEEGGSAGTDGRFLLCWTRKEALVKAVGAGLSFDLRSFSVPLTSPGGIVPIDHPGGGPARRWLLLDVPLGGEHVAALALPASVLDHNAVRAPGPARARSGRPPDHCEEIDVLPLVSRAMSSSVV
jgi:4'-phosphopantetheinyl transferase